MQNVRLQKPAWLSHFGLKFPIIQAPMAGISTPQLAAAVSNAGGLGSLGLGSSSLEHARATIVETQELTSKPFNVNVFCHEPAQRDATKETAWLNYLSPLFADVGLTPPTQLHEIYPSFLQHDAMFELLLELCPAVVSFHFGLPTSQQIRALHHRGILTLASVTNLEEAMLAEEVGIDSLIAQGIEAGGHRGCFDPSASDEQLETMALVQQLVQRTSRPIVAAGGIRTGQEMASVMCLGAVAVQLGSAFLLCPEAATNAGYRQMLTSERAAVTCLTSSLSGRPARGIVNRFITHCESAVNVTPADYPLAYDAAKQIIQAANRQGNYELAAHWVGKGTTLLREMPAQVLVETLVQEWQEYR